VKFSVCPSILLNSKECSPLGVNEGVNITPGLQISPPGAKFIPRDEIHPWGPGVKLRNDLWVFLSIEKNMPDKSFTYNNETERFV
jgi:hypothetical protein